MKSSNATLSASSEIETDRGDGQKIGEQRKKSERMEKIRTNIVTKSEKHMVCRSSSCTMPYTAVKTMLHLENASATYNQMLHVIVVNTC